MLYYVNDMNINQILKRFRVHHIRHPGDAQTGPGETIFQEGHKSEDVFIVLTGATETPDKQHLHALQLHIVMI